MLSLEFGDIIEATVDGPNSGELSPDETMVAYIMDEKPNQILINNIDTGKDVAIIVCENDIEQFSWSPDSTMIMTLATNLNEINIYLLSNLRLNTQLSPKYASVFGGLVETARVEWAPDNNSVLIFGVLSIHLIVWEFRRGSFRRLVAPKSLNESVSFSKSGKKLAILHRGKASDSLTVFNTKGYIRSNSFDLSTIDANIIEWSEDDKYVAVIDKNDHHLLQVVDLETNNIVDYSAYDGFLGIGAIAICPNSRIVAIGSYDNIVRLLVVNDEVGWSILSECTHETSFDSSINSVYVERGGRLVLNSERPFDLPVSDPNINGIRSISWSHSGNYMATVAIKTPKAVFVWDTKAMSPSVLLFDGDVIDVAWHPTGDVLAVTSESGFVCMWTPKKVDSIDPPGSEMKAHYIRWSKSGKKVITIDEDERLISIGYVN